MKRTLLAAAVAVAWTCAIHAQTADEAIVQQFYPQSLGLAVDPQDLIRRYTFQRADLDGTGHPDYLVCVYFNGMNDMLRLLRVQNGVGSLVTDADALPPIGGRLGAVTLADLDGDGKPEIWLSIGGERSSEDWLLKWNDGRLSLMDGTTTRDRRGRPQTLLSSIELLDIDGDGLPEVLSHHITSAHTPITWVYKFSSGKFVRMADVVFRQRLVRTSGDPDQFEAPLQVDTPGDYILRIVNGDVTGAHQLTGGEVDVNDAAIVTDDDFRKRNRVISVPVTLGAMNDIYVELRGASAGQITVSVSKTQQTLTSSSPAR